MTLLKKRATLTLKLYLCNVGKGLKNKLCLVATVVFLLVSVDFISVYLYSENNIEACCGCPDFTKHSGHSHHHAFEDEVLHRETDAGQQKTDIFKDFKLTLNLLFKDGYHSKVFQPPKIS